ncbi:MULTISPECIES: hypothetical protein [unclassified Endozoicomonas]|uniref:hypothetical protein n=1 Tax=unclassified Endozoicomonas TaxID=2644528 RepID=UPI003BB534A2
MNEPVIVTITETGFQTLSLLKGYMSAFFEEEELNALLTELLINTEQRIKEVAIRPVCPELALIGIHDYWQLNLMQNYKVIYRFDESTGTAFIIAFMRQKQSAEKLLVDLALM